MTQHTWLLIAVPVLLFGCNHEGDLNEVCRAFSELDKQPTLEAMGYAQRMAFVSARVDERVSRLSSVHRLWDLVPSFVPEARYRMFKRGANELVPNWACADMERLAPTLSEPILDSQ